MPKIVDHDEHRKVLLKACFELFARKGFRNVTMREIAQETGVSTGALYHYFPTKEHILEQMFAWAAEDDIEAYSAHANRQVSVAARLGNLSQFWVGNERFYQNLLLLALDLFRARPAESERVFREYADHYRDAVTTILGASPRLAEFIVSYLLGLVVLSVLTKRSFGSAAQAAFLRDVLATLLARANTAAAGGNGKVAGRPGRRTKPRRRRESGVTATRH